MGREGGGGVAPWGARDRPGLIRRDLQEQAELHIYAHTRRRRRRLQVQKEKKKKIAEVTSLLSPPNGMVMMIAGGLEGREWPKIRSQLITNSLVYVFQKNAKKKS